MTAKQIVFHQQARGEMLKGVNILANAATEAYGDLVAMGSIDPTKVVRLALQNATAADDGGSRCGTAEGGEDANHVTGHGGHDLAIVRHAATNPARLFATRRSS